MLGWINRSIKDFIVIKFGAEAWDAIVAKYPHDVKWKSQCPYSDKLTVDLVVTAAEHLGVSVGDALEAYGDYFVDFVSSVGYEKLLQVLGSTLFDFLQNLNNLHQLLNFSFPHMLAPSFRCERVEGDAKKLQLYYISGRSGLYRIVVGIIKKLAKTHFEIDAKVELVREADLPTGQFEYLLSVSSLGRDIDYCAAVPSPVLKELRCRALSMSEKADTPPPTTPVTPVPDSKESSLLFSRDNFFQLFPFSFFVDADCKIQTLSLFLHRMTSMSVGDFIGDHVDIMHPGDASFQLAPLLDLTRTKTGVILKLRSNGLQLKGQFTDVTKKLNQSALSGLQAGFTSAVFTCSPRVRSMEEMRQFGVFMSDIPSHDSCSDLVMLSELRVAEAELSQRIETLNLQLEMERKRSDQLLYQMLPVPVADSLRCGTKVPAQHYPEVTILFSDMVGFTKISAKSPPENVFRLLDDLYSALDTELVHFPEIYKVETIGDAYMLVANLTSSCSNHVDRMIQFALRMLEIATTIDSGVAGMPVQLRVGMHTGSVVAGVVGKKMPGFALFGDTVNTASRMETTSTVGRIHMSDESRRLIRDEHVFEIEARGGIDVKGKGLMHTYFVDAARKAPAAV